MRNIFVLFNSTWTHTIGINLNPLNPNIEIQILICYSYTFSIETVGRIC